jgi:hypothetical protein
MPMKPSGIVLGVALIASGTPVLAERAAEPEPRSDLRPAETVQASSGFESALRRAFDSLGRLRLHPGRDSVDGPDIRRDRPAEQPSK